MIAAAALPTDRGLTAERRRLLLLAAPLIGVICLASLYAVAELPRVMFAEKAAFAAVGVLLLLISALLALRRIGYQAAAFGTVTLTAGLLLLRLIESFANGTFEDPSRSFFMAVYAHYATLYLLFLMLLPYPVSARFGVAAWLALAIIVTIGTQPYWHADPPRQLLSATLIYVWPGHGLFVTLLFGWARQQKRLLDAHSQLAAAEHAERLAREASEIRFRGVFEQVAAGIGLFGTDGRWLEVNTRLCELLGYSASELIGQPMTGVTPAEDHDPFRIRMHALMSGPAPNYSVERRAIRKDGQVVWLHAQMRRLETAAGQPAQGVLVAIDITQRKLAEERSLEDQRVREFHFENTPLAMIEWTPDMRLKRLSPQAQRMFGWSEAELLGRHLFELDFIHPDDVALAQTLAAPLFEGVDASAPAPLRNRRKDGSYGWYEWHNSILHDAEGRLQSVYSMAHDISELRFALQARVESDNQFRAIFEQAAIGIALLDEDGHWLTVNHRLCAIVGYSREELLKLDFQALTYPEDLAADLALAHQVATGAIDHYSMDKRYVHKQGHIVWITLYVRRIEASETTPMRFVSVIEDISERKRVEAEALEHQRVREFHFENTPLAVIEWTPDFSVRRWSRRAEELFGWTEAETIGRNPFEWQFVHDSDRAATEVMVRTLLTGAASQNHFVNRIHHKNGKTIWCHWHNSMLRDKSGKPASLFSLVNDVTVTQATLEALHDSEALFRSLFEQAAVGIAMLDLNGDWLMINQRLCEIVGYSKEEVQRHTCLGITHGEDQPQDRLLTAQLLSGEINDFSLEKRYVRKDGSAVWVQVFVRRIEATASTPMRYVRVVEDISERKQAEAAVGKLTSELERTVLNRTQQLQQTMRNWGERNQELSLLAEMMGVLPAARDAGEANQIVARYLPKLFQRYGGAIYLEGDVPDRFLLLKKWGENGTGINALTTDDCWALRRGQVLRVEDPEDPLTCPHLGTHGHAQEPHVCMPITALGRAVGLLYLSWSERVSALTGPPDRVLLASAAEQIGLAIGNVRLREELHRQAMRDPLTGLYNRRHFDEYFARRVAGQTRGNERGFVLLMIDIDFFKRVNDDYGHEIGDEVLRATGALLQRIVRAEEAVFRLGGEEFVMLINEDDGSQAVGCAERVRSEIENHRSAHQGRTLPAVTVSIGVVCCPDDGSDGTALLQQADAALYAAKRTGRNRVCHAGAVPGQGAIASVLPAKLPAPEASHGRKRRR